MSTPITPLNAPLPDQLMYPLDFVPTELAPLTSGFTPEFGAFSQWLNQDMDATPTLVSDDKSLGAVPDV